LKDDEVAVLSASDVSFWVAAGLWTQPVKRGTFIPQRIRARTVWVNACRGMSFTMPFGGFKSSGVWRENGLTGIDEYLETKSVWVSTASNTGNPFVMKTAVQS